VERRGTVALPALLLLPLWLLLKLLNQDGQRDNLQMSPSRDSQRNAKEEGVEALGEGEWMP
jgi:hypothetical protein